MNLTSPSQVKAWCIENGFHPNKVLGQNFLIDQNALRAIVDAGFAGRDPKGLEVLEIGPGLGVLTEEMLARGARVTAIEKDPVLAARLAASLGNPPGLEVVEGDALEVLERWSSECLSQGAGNGERGTGNGERGTGNGEREDGHETGDERRDEVPSRLASNVSRPTPPTPTPPNPNTSPLISLILRILRYGVPSGAYTALNLLSFTIFVFVTGRVGDVAFAVSNACFSVNYLLFAPMEGFSIGAATLVGEAQGRGDPDAAHRAAMRTLLLGVSFVAAISLAAVVLSRPILALFAPKGAAESAEFLSLGTTLFLWMAAWQVFDATDIIISGALKGAGDTKFVFWWMLIVAFGVWLPVVWIVARAGGGMAALWSTMVVYVVVICVGSLIRWRFGRWRRIKLV